MDGGDLWSSRLSSSSSSSFRRYQLRSEAYLGGDDLEVEDDYKQEFSCPFCADEFDIVGLFCHMDEEHQVELKNGVCPVCAKRVGMDMVGHITMQHGNILKVQRRRRLRRGVPNSMFSILRKELREGNRQSLFGGSSFTLSSSNPDPDPLLSSLIYSSSSAEELGKGEPCSSKETSPLPQAVEETIESSQHSVLSEKEHEEKARKCEFVRGLLLSTMLDDIL
ncbi:protein DEHYDRATION-INDUCED 19 homolog 4-like [Chenopodium quinoa]|uniref:Protein DEHYDRATION-INDUCED 19 homolog 4-like n=1 Tax=Chenopodium quinoa TaxID=63459 RepID=A0A803MTT0_CHEQI|nr:protein DEHYDRATION-INDUCED 19 homolog 4-like [Chenopodium quinoa]